MHWFLTSVRLVTSHSSTDF
nr:unnamed protein product [Callosobruchus chinensis]